MLDHVGSDLRVRAHIAVAGGRGVSDSPKWPRLGLWCLSPAAQRGKIEWSFATVDLLCGSTQRRERRRDGLNALVVQAGQERDAMSGTFGHQLLHQI